MGCSSCASSGVDNNHFGTNFCGVGLIYDPGCAPSPSHSLTLWARQSQGNSHITCTDDHQTYLQNVATAGVSVLPGNIAEAAFRSTSIVAPPTSGGGVFVTGGTPNTVRYSAPIIEPSSKVRFRIKLSAWNGQQIGLADANGQGFAIKVSLLLSHSETIAVLFVCSCFHLNRSTLIELVCSTSLLSMARYNKVQMR